MKSIIAIGFLLYLTAPSCQADYTCYCGKDSTVTTYIIREKNGTRAFDKCDAMASGDTCMLMEKK